MVLGILIGTADIKVYQEYSLSHRKLTLEEGRVTRKQMVCYAPIYTYYGTYLWTSNIKSNFT